MHSESTSVEDEAAEPQETLILSCIFIIFIVEYIGDKLLIVNY